MDVERAESLICGYCRNYDLHNICFAENIIYEYFGIYGLILHDIDLAETTNNNKNDTEMLQDIITSFIASNTTICRQHINSKFKMSVLVAKVCNDILTKSNKIIINSLQIDMDHMYDIIAMLSKNQQIEFDIFERDYYKYLSNRLLNNLYTSYDMEHLMMTKLKLSMSCSTRLKNMIKDVELSKKEMIKFNAMHNFQFEMNTICCRTDVWSTVSYSPIKVHNIDDDIHFAMQQFKTYWSYQYNINQRFVNFQMSKGKAEMRVQFNHQTLKILVVSTYQMLILLLFNKKNIFSFDEILKHTGIDKVELIDSILSMAHPKIKILKKSPNNRNIANDHKFQLNASYKNKRTRIVVPTFNMNKTENNMRDNDKLGMETILRTRRHQIDAVIVRIMKRWNTLKQSDLMAHVAKQLKEQFTATPVDIKKRIVNLIELEYLERDDDDRHTYHYKM